MKIIKPPEANWSKEVTCKLCKAVLSVEHQDIKYEWIEGDKRDPGYATYSATCPCCSFSLPFAKTDFTPYILHLIETD
jgi:hypothetical protein